MAVHKTASRRPEHIFFSAIAAALALVVFAGFAQTFYLRPFFDEPGGAPESIFYFHGLLFTAWILLLVAQTNFVRTGSVRRHMAIGNAAIFLAAAIFVVGIYIFIVAAARPGGFIGVPIPPLQFLIVPIGDMVLFALFAGLAFWWRRKPPLHKRLMLLATISLVNAATARIVFATPLAAVPFADFLLVDLFVVAMLLWDWISTRRLNSATLWGGLLLIASQPLRLLASGTETWISFASWLTGVPA